MNDTTNTQDAAPMHITMEMDATDAELNYLTARLFESIRPHIEELVQRTFDRLVQNTKALSLMDEALREYITEQIDDRISEHESDKDHIDEEDIRTYAADEARDVIRNEDVMTKDNMETYINDYLDEELDGRIEMVLDSVLTDKLETATISISI